MGHFSETCVATAAALVLSLSLAPRPVAAQLRGSLPEPAPPVSSAAAGYQVRPVDGAPAEPGVRRVIERFSGWTLICDETKGRRICNASQSISSPDGSLAFSWSLAATRGGEPVFLIRAPVMGSSARTVALDFGGAERLIRLADCDARLCLGFLPLDPGIVRRIKARGEVALRYDLAAGAPPVAITTSLDGLGTAIANIR